VNKKSQQAGGGGKKKSVFLFKGDGVHVKEKMDPLSGSTGACERTKRKKEKP